jgi:ATP-dependent helicase IRC3
MTTTQLRDYQVDTIEQIRLRRCSGAIKVLAVLATGLGKTFTAVMYGAEHRRVLWLAHRDELLDQAAEAFERAIPGAHIGGALTGGTGPRIGKIAASLNDIDADIVVASVQTLRSQRRLDQLAATRPFDLVIVDECHHIRWNPKKPQDKCAYRTIIDHLQPEFVLGLTATPDRLDKLSVADYFDHQIAVNYDTAWAIRNGYLKDLRAIRVSVKVDLDSVKTRGGDFVDGDLGRALHESAVPAQMVQAWLDRGEDRTTIAFAPTVQTSKELCEAFEQAGVAAAHVDGETDRTQRRRIFDDLRAGALKVVCNVGVATEGFDAPRVNCILLCRPTQSRSLYAQMVGRGLRLFPGDTDCLVIDIAGATSSNQLVMAHDLLGLHRALADHETAKGRMEDDRRAAEKAEQERLQAIEADETEQYEHGARLLYRHANAVGSARASKHQWIHLPQPGRPDRFCHTPTGTDQTLVIRRGPEGTKTWEVGYNGARGPVLLHRGLLRDVIVAADRHIDGEVKEHGWKADQASAPQLKELERLGIDHTQIEKLTKKKASKLIDEAHRGRPTRMPDETRAALDMITRAAVLEIGAFRMSDLPTYLGLPSTARQSNVMHRLSWVLKDLIASGELVETGDGFYRTALAS